MLYERYEAKIQRVAKAKSILFKFKVPIISLLVLLLATVVGLLSVKGSITTDLQSVSDITYGEKITLYAESLWGECTFEFREVKSSSWSSTEPIIPGEYEVRATSNKPFGTAKGETFTFTISPKDSNIKVSNSSLVFGNTPSFTASLESGDTITYGDIDYENFYSLETQTVSPIVESIKIVNKEGVDVSTCYNFTPIESNLTLTKRSVSFTASSTNKTYDGTNLSFNEHTVSNLIEGHEYDYEITGSIKNFGTTQNVISVDKIYVGNNDITHMYNITKINGALSINKKDLVITTESASKTYDSTELINTKFTNTGLVSGDEIILISNNSITFYGEVNNNLVVSTNSDGFSNNYNITYVYGKLTINQKDITITTQSAEKVYDGSYLQNANVDFTLEGNDDYYITSASKITYAGEIENNVVIATYNGSTNCTSSYNITYVYGKLKITQKDITIVASDASKVYDGTILENKLFTSNGLVSGDIITVVTNTQITDVSSVANKLTIKITQNSTDVSYCYNIKYVDGTLTITAREVVVITKDDTKEYDGTSLSNNGWEYVSSNKLSLTHELVITTNASITNVGSVENTHTSFVVNEGSKDVTSNYIIKVTHGTLTITARKITVTTDSATKEYDGTALTKDTYTITSSNFVLDHKLELNIIGTITNAGSVSNSTDNTYEVLSGSTNVTSNYDVTVLLGSLTITSRKVTVTTDSAEKVYDATPLTKDTYTITSSNFVLDHKLELNIIGTITNVGTVSNITDNTYEVLSGSTNVTSNYEVTVLLGTLTITAREVTIITGSAEKEYDGTNLEADTWSYDNTKFELVEGHTLNLVITGFKLEVGTSDNTYSTFTITDSSSNVSSNYIVTINEGTLEVTSRTVSVTTSNGEYVYNGQFQINENHSVSNIVDFHYSTVDQKVGEKDVTDSGKNTYSIKIYDENDNDVTSNYNIESYIYGELVITKKVVVIKTNDDKKVYDGTPLTNSIIVYLGGTSIVEGHELYITVNGTITNFGTEDNTYENEYILDENSIDVSNNYDLRIETGILEIEKRSVSVITATGEKVYDGEELVVDGWEYNNSTYLLVEGHELTITASASLTDVGEEINYYNEDKVIVLFNEEDVTNNYELTIDLGKIIITHRLLTIVTDSAEKVYDGTSLTKDSWSYDNTEYELVEGHTLNLVTTGSQLDVGASSNTYNEIYSIVNGSKDVTNNYKLTITEGELVVTNRFIKVESNSNSKIYDSYILEDNGYDIVIDLNLDLYDLAEGHTFKSVVIEAQILNVGTIENTILNIIIVDKDDNDVTDNYNISKVHGTLEITQREIVISVDSAEKTYDNTELVSNDVYVEELSGDRGLAKNDGFELLTWGSITDYQDEVYYNNITFIISNSSVDYGDFNPNDNYIISGLEENGITISTLTINKIELEITTDDYSDVYDGSYLYCEDYNVTSGKLVEGQVLEVSSNTKVSLVTQGIVENKLVLTITSQSDGEDKSHNYNITYTYGKLQMFAKTIELTTSSAEKIYDGSELYARSFEDETVLLLNDYFSFNNESSSSIIYFGEIDNVLIFDIHNPLLGNVSCNYDYVDSLDYGTLSITKRVITVITGTQEFEYDAEAHKFEEWDYASSIHFISSDKVTVIFINSVTNVSDGLVDNEVELVVGYAPASDSYQLEYDELGTISVTPRKIVITTSSDNTEIGSDNFPLMNNDYSPKVGLEGHDVYVEVDGYIDYVGKVDNTIVEGTFVVTDKEGNDVTENYSPEYILGELEVTTNIITITTGSDSKEYDGESLTNNYVIVSKGELILYEGDSSNPIYLADSIYLFVNITGKVEVFGVEENYFTSYVEINGEVVEGAYLIEDNFGILEITQRIVHFESNSEQFEFTGAEFTHEDYFIDTTNGKNDLVDGDTAIVVYLTSVSAVGEHENMILIYINDEDHTKYYDIQWTYGTITILPGTIYLTTYDKQFTYANTDFHYTDHLIEGNFEGEFSDLFIYSLTNITTIRNVGSIENKFDLVIMSNGSDISNWFNIEYKEIGTLEVIAKDVVVSVNGGSVEYQYDGTEQTIALKDIKITSADGDFYGSIDGHTPIVTASRYLITYDAVDLEFTISLSNGNYNIRYEIDGATITIIKRVVLLATVDYEAEYNGNAQSSNKIGILDGYSLVSGHTLSYTNTTKVTDINYYDGEFIGNEEDYIIYFYGIYIRELDSTDDYYDISFASNKGMIKITQIDVTITTESDEKVYDGTQLINQSATINGGLLVNHSIISVMNSSITNVLYDEYNNVIGIENEYETSYDSSYYSNGILIYNITNKLGTLTITPCELTITPYTLKKQYGTSGNYLIETKGYTGFMTSGNLVSGHVVTLDAREECIDFVGVLYLTNVRIDLGTESKLSNYSVTLNEGRVIYTQIILEFTAESIEREYNGEAAVASSSTITSGYLLEGHYYVAEYSGTRTAKGTTVTKIESIKIYNSNGNELSEEEIATYYIIKDFVNGTIKIT